MLVRKAMARVLLLTLAFSLPLGCAPQHAYPAKDEAVRSFRKELAKRVNEGQKLWSDVHQLSLKEGVNSALLPPKIQQLKGTLGAHYLWLQEQSASLNGHYPNAVSGEIQQHAARYFAERVSSAAIMEGYLAKPDEAAKERFEAATKKADQSFRALEVALGARLPAAIQPAAHTRPFQPGRDGAKVKAVLAHIPGITRVVSDPKRGLVVTTARQNPQAAKKTVEAAAKAVHQTFQGQFRDVHLAFRTPDNRPTFDLFVLTDPKRQIKALKGSHALAVMGSYAAVIQEHPPQKAVAPVRRQVAPARRHVAPRRHVAVRRYPAQRRYVPRRPVRHR